MKSFFAATIATVILSAAAHAGEAEFHPSTYTTYKKHGPHSGSVQVLERLPAVGTYTEIGIVRIKTQTTNGHSVVGELKEKAAQHGGTAIILEDDAKIFMADGVTPSGSKPQNATAIAVIRH